MARHCNVAPDWFDSKAAIWRDWAILHLNVSRAVEANQMERAKRG